MTPKGKANVDEATTDSEAAEPAKVDAEAPLCGTPHFLPALAHLTCTEPAADPDRVPGAPDHQHRHQDGDAIYTW